MTISITSLLCYPVSSRLLTTLHLVLFFVLMFHSYFHLFVPHHAVDYAICTAHHAILDTYTCVCMAVEWQRMCDIRYQTCIGSGTRSLHHLIES